MATLGVGSAKTREPRSVPARLASSAPGDVKDTGTFDSTKSRVGWTLNKEEGALNSLSKYLFFGGHSVILEKAVVECLQFWL